MMIIKPRSTSSFIDLLTSEVFPRKEVISYYDPFASNGSNNILTDFFKADITTTGDGFSISGIPATIQIGQPLSPTVTSLEEGYLGTVVFSSSDIDADLPSRYEFSQLDDDSHTFTYGLRFKTIGTQRVMVSDADNPNVKVEAIIEVTGAKSTIELGATETFIQSDDLQITVPKSRSRLKSRDFDIIGTAPPNTDITIFDG